MCVALIPNPSPLIWRRELRLDYFLDVLPLSFAKERAGRGLAGTFLECDVYSASQVTRYGLRATGYALIFFGALSNLFDRLLYHHTVDYLLIFTAVINLADVMIVGGFVIYFLMIKSEARNTKIETNSHL